MTIGIERRRFLTALGGAGALPFAARAQQPVMPVIGYLTGGGPTTVVQTMAAFRQGLGEAGYIEGRNVAIHHSWADGQYDRMPALVAELVRRQVNVIVVSGGGGLATKAAKAATSTIPIVFTGGFDPVELGVVTSLSRPGGNLTGVSWFSNALEAKRLGLLRVAVPQARVIGVLRNPTNSSAASQSRDLAEAARALGIELHIVDASDVRDFDGAFAS